MTPSTPVVRPSPEVDASACRSAGRREPSEELRAAVGCSSVTPRDAPVTSEERRHPRSGTVRCIVLRRTGRVEAGVPRAPSVRYSPSPISGRGGRAPPNDQQDRGTHPREREARPHPTPPGHSPCIDRASVSDRLRISPDLAGLTGRDHGFSARRGTDEAERLAHLVGEALDVEEINQKAVFFVLEKFRHRWRGGADDKASGGHRLEHRPG